MPWHAWGGGWGQYTHDTTYFQDTCVCHSQPVQEPQPSALLVQRLRHCHDREFGVTSQSPDGWVHTHVNQAGLEFIESHGALPLQCWDKHCVPLRSLPSGSQHWPWAKSFGPCTSISSYVKQESLRAPAWYVCMYVYTHGSHRTILGVTSFEAGPSVA